MMTSKEFQRGRCGRLHAAERSLPCAASFGACPIYGCPGMTTDARKFELPSCEDPQIRFVTLPEMGKVELRA